LPFQWASGPCSHDDLPGVFQPGALTGFLPSKRDLTGIVRVSRPDIPSCDWQSSYPCRLDFRPSAVVPPRHPTSPRHARRRVSVGHPATGQPFGGHRTVPVHRATRDRRHVHAFRRDEASLQGFDPPAGWDTVSRISPIRGDLAFLGFLLPGAFPFPALDLSVQCSPWAFRTRDLQGAPSSSSMVVGVHQLAPIRSAFGLLSGTSG